MVRVVSMAYVYPAGKDWGTHLAEGCPNPPKPSAAQLIRPRQ